MSHGKSIRGATNGIIDDNEDGSSGLSKIACLEIEDPLVLVPSIK